MSVIDLLLLSGFSLTFGVVAFSLGLVLALSLRRGQVPLRKTFYFLAYLALLYFLSGLRFGAIALLDWSHPAVLQVFSIIGRVAYASLLYFLPATINYVLGRRWTWGRLLRVIITAVVYLGAGIVSLYTRGAVALAGTAAFGFLFMVVFILLDASRSIPLVGDDPTRVSLAFLYGLTFLFLPFVQVLPLLIEGQDHLLFLVSCGYFLILGGTVVIFASRRLLAPEDSDEEGDFRAACAGAGLTKREIDIAEGIAKGLAYKEIAADLDISPNTVGNHVSAIYRKTGTRSKVEMVNAIRGGVIDNPSSGI